MDQPNDIHPLQKAAELHLLAHVLELGHLTTPAIFMPIPMARGDKAQRFIFSGTRAEVERMLEMVPVPAAGDHDHSEGGHHD